MMIMALSLMILTAMGALHVITIIILSLVVWIIRNTVLIFGFRSRMTFTILSTRWVQYSKLKPSCVYRGRSYTHRQLPFPPIVFTSMHSS